MIEKATKRDLATGFNNHLEDINKPAEGLWHSISSGRSPCGTKFSAIGGIIKEAVETPGET